MTDERITSPAHTITLDGRELALRFDLQAMADFEEQSGHNVLRLVGEGLGVVSARVAELREQGLPPAALGAEVLRELVDVTGLRAGDLAILLWACAGGEDTGLTVREVGRAVTPATFANLGTALLASVNSAIAGGGDEADAEDAGDPTSRPTG